MRAYSCVTGILARVHERECSRPHSCALRVFSVYLVSSVLDVLIGDALAHA
jgi:hypothetical protein